MIYINLLNLRINVNIQNKSMLYIRYVGGCSQVVTAMGCDSIIRGFNSRHSPFISLTFLIKRLFIFDGLSIHWYLYIYIK